MIFAATLGILSGILLARHFRVFILVPVELAGIVLTAAMVVADQWTSPHAWMALLAWSVAMQLSFFATGLFVVAPATPAWERPRRA